MVTGEQKKAAFNVWEAMKALNQALNDAGVLGVHIELGATALMNPVNTGFTLLSSKTTGETVLPAR